MNQHHEHFDEEIVGLIEKEKQRRKETIQLIAAENIVRSEVMRPLSSILVSKTAEGVPGNRYHSGCSVVDEIETIAERRVEEAFKARKAWVQPLSGTLANLIVYLSLVRSKKKRGEEFKILSMGLDQGGHLSHGSSFHVSSFFCSDVRNYSVSRETGLLDYDMIRNISRGYSPDLIVCGGSAYPREIDFATLGEIAKDAGAVLLADIAHIYGLVVSGIHQSPIPHSHFVTCSTYKAGGPKGGIIVSGDLATDEQCRSVTQAIFPGVQSTPDFASIAAKAVFFAESVTDEFRNTQRRIVENAKYLSSCLMERGFDVITGGTDNHIVLINVKTSACRLTGKEANERLERCGVIVNKNMIPYDNEKANVGSGIRIGTNTVSRLGMNTNDMEFIANLIEEILMGDMSDGFVSKAQSRVKEFMKEFSFEGFI